MGVSFGMYHTVTVVRNSGTSQEEEQVDVQVGGSLDENILYTPDVDIKKGDEIRSPVFDEPRVVTAIHPQFTFDGLSHYDAELVPCSECESPDTALFPMQVNQTVYGDVGKLAARDVTDVNINVVTLLEVLSQAIEDAPDIPIEQKRSLVEKITGLKNDPFVVAIGSAVVVKAVEAMCR